MNRKYNTAFMAIVRSLAGALLLVSLILKINGQAVDFTKGILTGIILGSFFCEVVKKPPYLWRSLRS